jgi:D-serine deaminase-like pyridoxal phosphate-dependent protein
MTNQLPLVSVPTLLINTSQCIQNIRKIHNKAIKGSVIFRPHFKTHQSEVIGHLFKQEGIACITVSSLRMAAEFAQQGWRDIAVAFPVNILEMDVINDLAAKITLSLLLESKETAEYISQRLQHKVQVYVKIDTGYHRTGINASSVDEIGALLDFITRLPNIECKGFLAHAGHSYKAHGSEELERIYSYTLAQLKLLQAQFSAKYPNLIISIGDTPTCSITKSFEGADEIRPGNFVYYDATQLFIGSCRLNQIAAFMACPVVAKHEERKELVIYGGAVHFSKDLLNHPVYGACYGLLAEWTNEGLKLVEECFVKSLSQEHGILSASVSYLDTKKPGDIIYVIPVHSCLTAHLMKADTLYF